MSTPPSGETPPSAPLVAENADLRQRLALAEQALKAELERASRSASLNPFQVSQQQLRDDLAGMVELLPAFVGMFTPEGHMIFVNVSGSALLNLEPGSIGQINLRDLYPPAAAERLRTEVLPTAAGGGIWTGDITMRSRDGREIPVSQTVIAHRAPGGHVRTYSVVALDVTERNLAMDLLREQTALLENAHEAIAEVDLDGRIVLWNHGAQSLYGWSNEEAVGRRIADLTYTNERDFRKARQATLEAGKWSGEVMRVTRAGAQLMVESRWSLLRDDRGQPKAFIIISADITEKKRLAAQFLRAQRMESIGTLAGGIAHDLNNVLAPILLGVEILKQRITDESSLRMLNTFEVGARRGAAMVRQVLAFSRGIDGERIPIAPSNFVREVEHLLLETLPKNIVVSTRTSKDDWPVLGDITQLHQMLLNLCINARDAMPQGGELTIETENVLIDDAYALVNPEAKPGHYVLTKVSDTGIGIPPAIRDKIFEPFFTTKEVGKGTGLGLSTVHTIIKSHGGFVHVYSEESKGTTFKVYLPAELTGQVQVQPISEQRFPRGQGELVMVVDDEEIIRETAKTVLERSGYRVLLARDGAEAVALYAQNLAGIAIVLTDITMPIMDGISTMRAIKRIKPDARIVCASGLSSDRQLTELTGAGMMYFIPKPFTAEALLQTLHKTLQGTDPVAGAK